MAEFSKVIRHMINPEKLNYLGSSVNILKLVLESSYTGQCILLHSGNVLRTDGRKNG